MTKFKNFTLAVLGLVALLMPMHLAAAEPDMFRFNVPFDFAVGSQSFGAGAYLVSSSEAMVRVYSVDGHANRVILGIPVDTKNGEIKTALVFKRYGDRYFLSQIWPASDRGSKLPTSTAEREAMARIPRGVPVTVMASR